MLLPPRPRTLTQPRKIYNLANDRASLDYLSATRFFGTHYVYFQETGRLLWRRWEGEGGDEGSAGVPLLALQYGGNWCVYPQKECILEKVMEINSFSSRSRNWWLKKDMAGQQTDNRLRDRFIERRVHEALFRTIGYHLDGHSHLVVSRVSRGGCFQLKTTFF